LPLAPWFCVVEFRLRLKGSGEGVDGDVVSRFSSLVDVAVASCCGTWLEGLILGIFLRIACIASGDFGCIALEGRDEF
jgi:hypothetical protein